MKINTGNTMTEKVYDYDGNVLFMGDIVRLKEPKDDEMFYGSNVGKLFKQGIMNELTLEVCKHDWCEVYFKVRYYLNGVPLTNGQLDLEEGHIENSFNQEICEEITGYRFLRYILSKSSTIEHC